jgi:hypothetical protein
VVVAVLHSRNHIGLMQADNGSNQLLWNSNMAARALCTILNTSFCVFQQHRKDLCRWPTLNVHASIIQTPEVLRRWLPNLIQAPEALRRWLPIQAPEVLKRWLPTTVLAQTSSVDTLEFAILISGTIFNGSASEQPGAQKLSKLTERVRHGFSRRCLACTAVWALMHKQVACSGLPKACKRHTPPPWMQHHPLSWRRLWWSDCRLNLDLGSFPSDLKAFFAIRRAAEL